MGSKIQPNTKKIDQKSIKNRSTSVPGGSGGVLGPSWLQDGTKSQKSSENLIRRIPWAPPLGGHYGAQNQSTSGPRAIRKVIVFMIDLKIDFGSDLVPIWLHLGLQNPPKIGPSWLQNRCKLECWFESCALMDFGNSFIDFLLQHDMAEVAKTFKKLIVFKHFWIFGCCVVGVIRW